QASRLLLVPTGLPPVCCGRSAGPARLRASSLVALAVPMPSIAVRASQSRRMRAYLRTPGDIRRGHGQQVAGDDVAGRIAARIGEGDPGKVRLLEVAGSRKYA